MYGETEFSIHHSFWYFLNPTRWTTRSLAAAFIAFYIILIPAYFIIGFRPATATAAEDTHIISDTSTDYLSIDSIDLHAPIIDVPLENSHLATPDYNIGRFVSQSGTTFLFAHSISAFHRLHEVADTDHILYSGNTYSITSISTKKVEDISMPDLLAQSEDTIILMTCAGSQIGGGYTHRLIITAER